MECSFCIWLARNNKAWFTKDIDLSLKTPEYPLVYQNPSSTPFKASSLKINSSLPVGFINKGTTCYANAILQTQSVLASLWNRVPSELPSLSPFLKLITLKKKRKSRSKNQLIHQIFQGLSLPRSQSLVTHHLILILSQILLRCYSLSLMNQRALLQQPVTWFQIPSELMFLVTNASVSLLKRRNQTY